jgi:alpha-amylase
MISKPPKRVNSMRMSTALLMLVLVGCSRPSDEPAPAPSESSSPRGTIVTLFEWRWDDVGEECEAVLGPAGYSAVQVSSPAENHVVVGRPWWERYQPVSYTLQTRSGSREEFSDMVTRCGQAGVDVYVDAVINHMTDSDLLHSEYGMTGTGTAGTEFSSFNYPGLYSFDDFHHCGLTENDDIWDFNDLTQLRECELVDLADLDTGSAHVRSVLAGYLADLQSLGVAGIRIDAALHMEPSDIRAILDEAGFRGYVYQEVSQAAQSAAYYGSGDVTDFAYGVALSRGMREGSLADLIAAPFWKSEFAHSATALVFVENHDTERHWDDVLNYRDEAYPMAVAMALATPFGRPRVFSGYSYEDDSAGPPANQQEEILRVHGEGGVGCGTEWVCEHRWPLIQGMVGFQAATQGEGVDRTQSDGPDRVAFTRGDQGFVAFNRSDEPWELVQQTGLPGTRYCNVAEGPPSGGLCAGSEVRVDAGMVSAMVPARGVLAIHTQAALE